MKILMVCLGNICRSPLAEAVLRTKAEERGVDVFIDSCGTSDYHIGEAPDPRTITNARINGIDVSNLRARQFQKEDFETFDLIYVMDQSNHQNIIELAETEAHRNKVKLILNELESGGNKPVPDPYFGGEEGFQLVFDLLNRASDKILDRIER